MNLFLDTEFTGLHQQSTLISLALVADDRRAFYAEFTDFDASQCDDWIQTHVLTRTRWLRNETAEPGNWQEGETTLCLGEGVQVRAALETWLSGFEHVDIWADCPAWDWVLFCQLFDGAFGLPKNIYFLPFDLVTLFRARDLDPDTDRAQYAGWNNGKGEKGVRHNALYDAYLTQACFQRLMEDGRHD